MARGGCAPRPASSAWSTTYASHLFVGQTAISARADGTGPETPLGFGLLLKERADEHFPLALQVGVRDARTGEKFDLLEIREGRGTAVPGRGLRLEVGPYDVGELWVTVRVSGPGSGGGDLRLDIVPEGRTSGRFWDYEVQLAAWRRNLRSVRGRIAIVEGGREVKEEWLGPNERIAHRGSSIFLTTWGEDQYRNPYLGVQMTRDPGASLFWAGAVLFAMATPFFVVMRHTALRKKDEAGR